jgi:transposase
MGLCEGGGLPLGIYLERASPGETTLVEPTLEARFSAAYPDRLLGDKAYDSDPLDERLMTRYGIELIAPHRSNRRRPATQDGRPLRRYRRRWKIERCFAWLYNFRRLVVRWDYKAENFLAFLQLGCAIILLRHL